VLPLNRTTLLADVQRAVNHTVDSVAAPDLLLVLAAPVLAPTPSPPVTLLTVSLNFLTDLVIWSLTDLGADPPGRLLPEFDAALLPVGLKLRLFLTEAALPGNGTALAARQPAHQFFCC
jgi:hypothetical protein